MKRICSWLLSFVMILSLVTPAMAYDEVQLHMYLPLDAHSSWIESSGCATNRRYLSPNAQKAATTTDGERGKLYWSDDILVTPDSNGTVVLHGMVGKGLSFGQGGHFDSTIASWDNLTYTVRRGTAQLSYHPNNDYLTINNMNIGDIIHIHYEYTNTLLGYHYTLDANIIAGDINWSDPLDLYSIHTLEPYNGHFTLRIPKGKFDGVLIGKDYTIYDPGAGFKYTASKSGVFNIDSGTVTIGGQKLPFLALIGVDVGRADLKIDAGSIYVPCWPYSRTFTIEVYNPVDTLRVEGQKTEYFVGDSFAKQGTVIFTDGETNAQDKTPLVESLTSGFTTATPGKKTVTVSYRGLKTTYTINVKARPDTIRVEGQKTEYTVGDKFVNQGHVIITDGDTHKETKYDLIESLTNGFDTSKPGKKTVTVTKDGLKTTYQITVVDKVIDRIEVLNPKVDYNQNQEFVKEGTLRVHYTNGTHSDISLSAEHLKDFSTAELGKHTVHVEYKGKETSYEITVKKPASLVVNNPETEYHKDEPFRPGDSTVTVDPGDGTPPYTKPLEESMLENFDTSVPGDHHVNVEVDGIKGGYDIHVDEKPLIDHIEVIDPKVEYKINEGFVEQGVIRVHYKNGTTEDVPLKESHTSGFTTETVGKKTVTVTYEGMQDTYEIIVKKPASLVINKPETEYHKDEAFRPGDSTVTVDPGDGTPPYTKPLDESMLENFDTSVPGDHHVNVEVDGVKGGYDIHVDEKPMIDHIVVVGPETEYEVDDPFKEQGHIEVHYENGEVEEIPLTDDNIQSGFDTSTPGNKDVIVEHNGKEDSFEIHVKEPVYITDIEVLNPQTDYTVGDAFKEQGQIKVNYSDGSHKLVDLKENHTSGFDTSSAGDKTVTVTYEGKQDSYEIHVKNPAPTISGIEVIDPETEYEVGDGFVNKGTIHITYTDGSTKDIPLTEDHLSGFDTGSAGTKDVIVSHEGHQDSYEIHVKEPIVNHTLTFHADDILDKDVIVIVQAGGSTAAVAIPTEKIPEGKELLGWSTDVSGNGTIYQPGDLIENVQSDMDFHIILKNETYSVTFDKSGILDEDKTVLVEYNGSTAAVEIPAEKIPENKELVGWSPDPSGNGTIYQPGDLIENIKGNLVFHIILKDKEPVIEDHTVTFDKSGILDENIIVTVPDGESTTAPQIPAEKIPEDKELAGWSTDPSGNGTIYQPGDVIENINGNLIFHIILTDKKPVVENHTVTFDKSGILDEDVIVIVQNGGSTAAIDIPQNKIPEDKDLVGWSTDPTGNGTIYRPGELIENITGNLVLHIILEDKYAPPTPAPEDHTVTFDKSGILDEDITVTVPDGSSTVAPQIPTEKVPADKEVEGWSTDLSGNGTIYQPGDVIENIDGDLIFHIIVKDKENGGNTPDPDKPGGGDNPGPGGGDNPGPGGGGDKPDPGGGGDKPDPDKPGGGDNPGPGGGDNPGPGGGGDKPDPDKPGGGDNPDPGGGGDKPDPDKPNPDQPGGGGSGGGGSKPDPTPTPNPGGGNSSNDDDDDDYIPPIKKPEHEDRPDFVQIDNEDVLNWKEHYSYLIGYADGTIRPENNISRGEAATIFFRLLTKTARDHYWKTSNPYEDVPVTLWCNNAISTLTNMDIIHGFDDGDFHSAENITRAQFAKMAMGFFEAEKVEFEGRFSDVNEHAWYAKYVEAAAKADLIEGFPDGTFHPDEYITRAQACVIINRILDRIPHEDHLLKRTMIEWPDNPKNKWYYEDIQEATNSHSYRWASKGYGSKKEIFEHWTKKDKEPDWAALETQWAKTNQDR